jgi:iron complex transport system substrate-binding protein
MFGLVHECSRYAPVLRSARAFLCLTAWGLVPLAAAHSPPASQRVVTLAPSLTELVFAAGAADLLVGASAHSDHPEAAKRLPRVADANGVNWESLLVLKPDLVLAWDGGTRAADVARLRSLGIRVLSIAVRRIDEIPARLREIGAQTGREAAAGAAALAFERELDAVRRAQAGKRPIRAFVAIAERPLMTVNRDHYLSDLISHCGAVNVFADLPASVAEPSREELVRRAPEVILRARSSAPRESAVYAGVAAFENGRIGEFAPDPAFRPGPRLIEALREICAALDGARRPLAGDQNWRKSR